MCGCFTVWKNNRGHLGSRGHQEDTTSVFAIKGKLNFLFIVGFRGGMRVL